MTIRLDIEYDGSLYFGWQIQPNRITVQESIEKALLTILRIPVKIIGAGRTDTGVHARGQVAHFVVESLSVSFPDLVRSLNGLLNDGITVRAACEVPETFHARYSAIARTYVYSISKRKRSVDRTLYFYLSYPLDIVIVREAAKKLCGTHDFRNFSIATADKSTLCTVHELTITETPHELFIRISANRFLHKMVRMIVGVLIDIGRGRIGLDYIDWALKGESGKLKKGFVVPPSALSLEAVTYP